MLAVEQGLTRPRAHAQTQQFGGLASQQEYMQMQQWFQSVDTDRSGQIDVRVAHEARVGQRKKVSMSLTSSYDMAAVQ